MPDEELDQMDDDTPPEQPQENHDLRRLREKAKGADDARAESDALRRELAFTKAGIDPDDPRQGYFVRGYTGELSASAIKEAASAAGFLGQANTSDQGMTEAERAAFAGTSAAAAGAGTPAPPQDFFEEFRNQSYRSGEAPENYGARLAQKIAQDGGEVAFDGPFREFPGDTGIVPRQGTPNPRRS